MADVDACLACGATTAEGAERLCAGGPPCGGHDAFGYLDRGDCDDAPRALGPLPPARVAAASIGVGEAPIACYDRMDGGTRGLRWAGPEAPPAGNPLRRPPPWPFVIAGPEDCGSRAEVEPGCGDPSADLVKP